MHCTSLKELLASRSPASQRRISTIANDLLRKVRQQVQREERLEPKSGSN